MKNGQHQRKIRLINRIIDTYFDLDSDGGNPATVCSFMEWLENGDYETAKNAALLRKFSEICHIEEQIEQLFNDLPKPTPAKRKL